MKGFMGLRSSVTSSRNIEKKKKKRDGINLQSDSILDQVSGSPGPSSPLRQISSDSSLASSVSSSAAMPHVPSPTNSHSVRSFDDTTLYSSQSCSSPSVRRSIFSKRASASPNTTELLHSVGEAAMLDEDSKVKQRDEQVQMLKSTLKKLIIANRRLNTDALRYSKSLTAFATDAMDKQQITEKRYTPDSVYSEALTRFSESERGVATNTAQFHLAPADQLIARITDFVEKDIFELKAMKSKYDRARRDYDGAVDKVTLLRAKSKVDVIKLYNAERDLKRLKKMYEDALEEVHTKLDDIDLKKSCSILEWLMLYSQQERDVYGENFAILQHIATYLQEIRTWTEESKAVFAEGVRARAEEQAIVVQAERDAIYDPLINLMQANPSVVQIIQRIMASEGRQNIPTPSPNDQTSITVFHQFVRDYYDTICQELMVSGRREQMKELASALGLLEKAKEDIEL